MIPGGVGSSQHWRDVPMPISKWPKGTKTEQGRGIVWFENKYVQRIYLGNQFCCGCVVNTGS